MTSNLRIAIKLIKKRAGVPSYISMLALCILFFYYTFPFTSAWGVEGWYYTLQRFGDLLGRYLSLAQLDSLLKNRELVLNFLSRIRGIVLDEYHIVFGFGKSFGIGD